jgi:Fe-S-cluster containining protein
MGRAEFVGAHCRWVPVLGGGDQLSLRERANYDCVFWKDGCSVYEARPLQCRTYPFWPSLLESRRAWDAMGCPGMGKGELHSREEIERAMALLREEPVIQRAGGDGA